MKKFLAKLKEIWIWLKSKFVPLKEKFLKFRTESGEVIQFSGADGLNYKIEEM